MFHGPNKTYIYGKHAVIEALKNRSNTIEKVFLTDPTQHEELIKLLRSKSIGQGSFEPNKLPPGVDSDATHQGVIGLISLDKLLIPYKEFIDGLKVNKDSCLIVLGELQDPQNVGAVIRSAAAFGISGILIPEHNQVQITGSVVKVSAGMAFRIPLVTVPNINNAIRDLKDKTFWIYGLDGESKKSISEEAFDTPTVFILGNEAKGIREKTLELCDILVKIPTNPVCESLNAATSAAVAMYAWSIKRPWAIKIKR